MSNTEPQKSFQTTCFLIFSFYFQKFVYKSDEQPMADTFFPTLDWMFRDLEKSDRNSFPFNQIW